MCAILDANVRHELTSDSSEAGSEFSDWLIAGRGKLVIGGAKLRSELYTPSIGTGSSLQKDFKNRNLITNPRGRVYTTILSKTFKDTHRNLLNNRNLCKSQ